LIHLRGLDVVPTSIARQRRLYVAANAPIVREQLQKAGVRLAHMGGSMAGSSGV
jgi:hypothetical protein